MIVLGKMSNLGVGYIRAFEISQAIRPPEVKQQGASQQLSECVTAI